MLFSRRRRTRATADSDMKKFFIFLDSSKKPNLVQESFYSDMWRWLSTLPEFLLSSSFANIVASYFLASSSAMWCHWSIQQQTQQLKACSEQGPLKVDNSTFYHILKQPPAEADSHQFVHCHHWIGFETPVFLVAAGSTNTNPGYTKEKFSSEQIPSTRQTAVTQRTSSISAQRTSRSGISLQSTLPKTSNQATRFPLICTRKKKTPN